MSTRRVGTESAEGVRVERLVCGAPDVEANVWLVGDNEECVVIDPPEEAAGVLEAVGRRRLTAVLSTHADPARVTAAPELLAERPRTRIGLHAADLEVWSATHPDLEPNLCLSDGDTVTTGDIELLVLHTPGHTPGSCCFHAPDLGVLFTGHTDVTGVERLRELDRATLVLPAEGEPTALGEAGSP